MAVSYIHIWLRLLRQRQHIQTIAGSPNTNPIILDANGECNLYLDDDKVYRLILKDANDVTYFDKDRVSSIGGGDYKVLTFNTIDDLKLKIGSEKAGRQSGRTELMNIYKDPAIADRLKAVFGNDYRKFASKLAAEFELKKFQRVAGGSQTAGRQQGLNDLELSPLRDASEGVGALASGSVRGSVSPLTRLWQGVSVPESVRTDMAKTLLLEGAPAQAKLQSLNELVKYINQQKQINAMRFGSTFGQLQGGNQ